MRPQTYQTKSGANLPMDVRHAFIEIFNRDIDMDLTYAIWQGLMQNISGVWLTRADFDKAWTLWWKAPKDYPIMTLVVDTEELMTATIMNISGKKLAA